MNKHRIAKLQNKIKAKGIDHVLLVPGANLFYYSGLQMGMSERPTLFIVPAEGEPVFCCPVLEADHIRELTGAEQLFTYNDNEGAGRAIEKWVKAFDLSGDIILGFEYKAARLLEYMLVKDYLPCFRVRDAGPLAECQRRIKDEDELRVMQRAAELADLMIQAISRVLKPGVTERELFKTAEEALKKAEPEAKVEFAIVASGPNGSFPHAGVTDREVREGEFVVIDIGARYRGYCSDITRTLPVGKVAEELARVYKAVMLANEKGREIARPGISCQEVDRAVRKVIEDYGFGPYFIHRTGHGLGIEVHEEPYIAEGNGLILKEGMVFTIEPGIYIPGRAGVRIEDDVVITKDGCRSLTHFSRELYNHLPVQPGRSS